MVRRPVVFIIAIAAFICVGGFSSFAQDRCVKPLRPNADTLIEVPGIAQVGFIYEDYFAAIERYLNCLNATSHRTINEARAVGGDYRRLLDRYGNKIKPVYSLPQTFQPGNGSKSDQNDGFLSDVSRTGRLILGDSATGQLIYTLPE